MKEKKSIKLNILIIIILIVLLIVGVLLFVVSSSKTEFSLSNSEIKHIADNYQYEIYDEKLRETYDELLGDATLIVSKTSARTLEDAQKLSIEYKEKLNENIKNDYIVSTYESHTDFEYIDFIETEYYYKYIGKYDYTYRRTSTLIEDHSQKYEFLIFKADYFNYPYLKKYDNGDEIKQFGDILAVLNCGNRKLIKSIVEDDGKNFIYELYYISKSYSGPTPDSSGLAPDVITATHYSLVKATYTVDKSTGKTDLNINNDSYQGSMVYKNSYYPRMKIETIKYFSE